MFGEGKSRGPGQDVYVGHLDELGVKGSVVAEERKRMVTSDTAEPEPVRGSSGGNLGSLPVTDDESGRTGNG